MAKKKFTQLPFADALTGDEIVAVVQSGTSKQTTAQDIADLFDGGTGTVTSFSAGNLSPLFTSSVATATTTPALTFAQVTQAANLVFAGPVTGADANPTFRALVAADIPDLTTVYQPIDSDLTAISSLTPSNDDFLQRKSGAWTNRSIGQVVSDLSSSFQPLDGDLTAIAALGFVAESFLKKTAANTWTLDTNTYLPTIGGTLTGFLFLHADPTQLFHASTKQYVDNSISALSTVYLPLSGGTLTGDLTLAGLPTNALHAATKSYVDNLITGLTWKTEVACATTANITLSGEQTIDGVTTSASRVLVKNQSTASQNGLYVSAAGAWARTTDADTGTELAGATVFVAEGTANANTQWSCSNVTITIGSTSVTFVQISGAGTYTADGTTLTLTGNVFSIATGYVGQTSITTLGTIATGTWNATTIGVAFGGTNITSYAVGDLIYASGTTALSKLAAVATGSVLGSAGTTTAPAYLAVSNGLTATATTFKLGGALTADTSISGTFSLSFAGGASGAGATVYTFTPTVTATANSQTQYGADINLIPVDGGFTGLTRSFMRMRSNSSATNTYDFGTSTFTTTGLTSADFNGGSMRLRNTTGPFNIQGGSGSTDCLRFSGVFTNSVDNHIAFRFTNGGSANSTALHTAGTAITRTWNALVHDWTVSSVNGSTITYIIDKVVPTFSVGNSTLTLTGYDYNPDLSASSGTITHYAMLLRSGNVGIADNTPNEKLSVAGNVKLRHLIGQSTAPSVAAGAGAGTTPTVTLSNATDISGLINLTTGTTPTGANAVILTITFNASYGVAPNIVLTPANDATASLPSNTVVFATSTTTTLVITSGSQPLTASTDYKWFFHAIQ